MKKLIIEISSAGLTFLILDAIWIGFIMKAHFSKLIEGIQGQPLEPNWTPAVLCYIFLIAGLYYFVISRVKSFDLMTVLGLAIPYGLVTYGTFDFTSATMLKGWDMTTAFLDVIWGAILCSASAISAIICREKFIEDDLVNTREYSKIT